MVRGQRGISRIRKGGESSERRSYWRPPRAVRVGGHHTKSGGRLDELENRLTSKLAPGPSHRGRKVWSTVDLGLARAAGVVARCRTVGRCRGLLVTSAAA